MHFYRIIFFRSLFYENIFPVKIYKKQVRVNLTLVIRLNLLNTKIIFLETKNYKRKHVPDGSF